MLCSVDNMTQINNWGEGGRDLCSTLVELWKRKHLTHLTLWWAITVKVTEKDQKTEKHNNAIGRGWNLSISLISYRESHMFTVNIMEPHLFRIYPPRDWNECWDKKPLSPLLYALPWEYNLMLQSARNVREKKRKRQIFKIPRLQGKKTSFSQPLPPPPLLFLLICAAESGSERLSLFFLLHVSSDKVCRFLAFIFHVCIFGCVCVCVCECVCVYFSCSQLSAHIPRWRYYSFVYS